MLNKIILFLVFLISLDSYCQEVIGRPDINKLDQFIEEVYQEASDDLVSKGSKKYIFYKEYLERIEYLSFKDINKINSIVNEITVDLLASTYTNLEFDHNPKFDSFNPLKYKLDAYNTNTVYYSIADKFIIKINSL